MVRKIKILPVNKTIFRHSLKAAAVMTKQTNNCLGSSWRLKRFPRLACNGTDELFPGATFETA